MSNINPVEFACEHMTRSELGIKPDDDIDKNLILSKNFAIEHLITNKEMHSQDDEIVTKIFESEIYFDEAEQQYAVPLLFKGGFPPENLPSNYELTVKRNNSLKHQIDQQKNHKIRSDLAELCMKERELRFIEPIPINDPDVKSGHFCHLF